MKKFFVLVLALAVGLMFAGCAKKQTVQSEQAAQETAQKASATEATKQTEPTSTKEDTKKMETIAVKELEAKTASSAFENIYFDFDKYNIRDDAKPALKVVIDWLLKNKASKLLIEGHCDERGTNEYNLALGERRAKSARDYIVSAGVTKKSLSIISYGEERPLCKEQTEECWQKNRRDQFVIK